MRIALGLLVMLAAAPAAAQSGSEVRRLRPVPPPPELAGRIRPRDRWARLGLAIDRTGRVTNCRILSTNEASSERRYYFCRAFLRDYRAEPLMENGVPVAGTITRVFVLPGRR